MTKITLVGAGSGQFGCTTLGEIFQSDVLKGAEIRLHDINAKALRRTYELAEKFRDAHWLNYTLLPSTDIHEALRDTDFVLIAIEPGERFTQWEQDWHIPHQFGISQVYGENGGPGGLFHSLRIIPPILRICSLVQQLSPNATIFNFSNPMSRICTAAQIRFPELKFIGLCHEIGHALRDVPRILEKNPEEVEITAAGLNHFSCVLSARYLPSNTDAFKDLLVKAPEYYRHAPGSSDFLRYAQETGNIVETEGHLHIQSSVKTSFRPFTERWTTKLFLEEYGLLPITSDSHFAEYLPWGYEVADHRGIADFFKYYRNFLCKRTPEIKLEVKERAIPIIEKMVQKQEFTESALNLPNRGAIKGLPDELAVEVPARFDGKEFHIPAIEGMTPAFLGLLQNQAAVHFLTAEAAIQGSRQLAYQALLADPVVGRKRGVEELLDTMIALQTPFLDYLT